MGELLYQHHHFNLQMSWHCFDKRTEKKKFSKYTILFVINGKFRRAKKIAMKTHEIFVGYNSNRKKKKKKTETIERKTIKSKEENA